MERILDTVRLHDFVVSNDERPVREVATEVLERAGWLDRRVDAD